MSQTSTIGMIKEKGISLHVEYMPISKLRRAPRNPKDHDIGQLDQSLDAFGYVAPVIINETTGRLVAGHGRLDTLQQRKAAGLPAPKRIKEESGEWLVPVVRGVEFDTDEEAEAYLLADNRHSELGGWDDSQLNAILADLAAVDKLEGTGWDADDVDRMLANSVDFEAPKDFKSYDENIETQHECPKCGYQWN